MKIATDMRQFLALTILLIASMLCAPALAADGSVGSYSIDLSPLVDTAIAAVAAGLLYLGKRVSAALISWLETKTSLDIDESSRALINHALERGIALGTARVSAQVGAGSEGPHVEMRSQIAAHAAEYAIAHVGDALKWFGKDRDAVVQMAEARLPSGNGA